MTGLPGGLTALVGEADVVGQWDVQSDVGDRREGGDREDGRQDLNRLKAGR